MRYLIVILYIFMINISATFSQSAIALKNPSFEDNHGQGRVPVGWYSCGAYNQTPPDIHHTQHPGANFEVTSPSAEGNTYLGLVVRDNGTTEGIGQALSEPLKAGKCYTFTFEAARSDTYISISSGTATIANFNKPVIIQIWGGDVNCGRNELLGVSPAIQSTTWQRHLITIQPSLTCNHLIFKASFVEGKGIYNGNVLVDNISPIIPTSCKGDIATIDWKPLKVDVPVLSEAEALKTFLREEGAQLTTDPSGYLFQTEVFVDDAGLAWQDNLHLWRIVKVMEQFPDYRMEWMIQEKKEEKRQSLKLQLNYLLQKGGLLANRYVIKSYTRRGIRKEEWLWPIEKSKLLLKLEKIE